jgi:hypothetical protein
MKIALAILNAIVNAARNKWVWFRVLVLVIVGFAGAILFSTTKEVKIKDCQEYIQALIEIKEVFSTPTSFIESGTPANFASLMWHDTVPKKRVPPEVQKILNKIDSLLKADSLLKLKQEPLKTKNKKS